MAKPIDAIFDPNSTWKPIEEGEYPAHIKSLTTKEVNTKAGEAIVVNMTYKVADEAADLEQLVYEMDGYKYKTDQSGNRIPVANGEGEQATTNCGHLVGRDMWDNGWFIFTNSESGSKNSRYFQLLESLSIKVEEQMLGDKKVKKLVLLEEEDVKGKAVLIDIKRQDYVTSDTKHLPPEQQEWRTSFKVNNVKTWLNGPALSVDEIDGDVPF
jgi:hypothetical protein|tara:strand:+ start:1226 stop:1861 length:636 start_codon:yes stop_codon:yes gene_type:complete